MSAVFYTAAFLKFAAYISFALHRIEWAAVQTRIMLGEIQNGGLLLTRVLGLPLVGSSSCARTYSLQCTLVIGHVAVSFCPDPWPRKVFDIVRSYLYVKNVAEKGQGCGLLNATFWQCLGPMGVRHLANSIVAHPALFMLPTPGPLMCQIITYVLQPCVSHLVWLIGV